MRHNFKKLLSVLIAVLMIVAVMPVAFADGPIAYEVHSGGIAVYTYYSGSVTKVEFPTWTNYNGQDDLYWHPGWAGSWTINGVYYNYAVWFPLSDHNNEGGTYITHVYINGNYYSAISYGVNTSPTVHRSTVVQNGTAGYYVYTYVTDNGTFGISRVQFPTWTNYNDQDDIQPEWWSNSAASGTAGSWTVDGQYYNYQYYVSFASHNGETGSYNTHIYAYNTIGNQGTGGVAFSPNFIAPSITKATAVQNGTGGFWIYANVATNGGFDIQRVQYPTWTNYNGQDDLAGNWETNSSITGSAGSWTVGGDTYNYRFYVDISAHNSEHGTYITDVYAYNKGGMRGGGNRVVYEFTFGVSVDPNGGTWSGIGNAQTVTGGIGTVTDIADPTPPTGYHFTEWTKGGAGTWNASAKQFTIGVGDGSLTANYTLNSYAVTFKHGVTGETLKTETVNHGSAATAPAVTEKIKIDGNADSHYTFTGWDKSYNNITGPTTVTAVYELTGHNLGSYSNNGNGTHSRTCGDCGYVETTSHSYTDAVTQPTCTAGGYTTHTCSACGYSYTDAQTPQQGHDYTVKQEEVTPATCLAPATAYYKCSRCDERMIKDVPDSQLDHDYSGDVKCNNDGTHQKKCVNGCGEYGDSVNCIYTDAVTQPTCTEQGYTTYTCTVCGFSYKADYEGANGHNYVYTPNNDGTHNVTCRNCDYEALNVDCTGGTATCVDKALCEYCETAYGDVDETNHADVREHEAVAATCFVAGHTAGDYCYACDTWVSGEATQQLTHTYTNYTHVVDGDDDPTNDQHIASCDNNCGTTDTKSCTFGEGVVTQPTCTEQGYTTYTCTVCGFSYKADYEGANGHDYVYTPNNDGTHNVTCRNCDYEALNVACTGGTATCVDKALCEYCETAYGDVDETNHADVRAHDEVAATCTAPGHTAGDYCYACDTWIGGESTQQIPHSFTEYVENVMPGTCVDNRVDKFKCANCDETEDREIENSTVATNHVGEEKTENQNVVNATCTVPGSYDTVVTCLSCMQVKSSTHYDGVTDPSRHVGETYTQDEDIVNATCAAPKTWNEVTYCADCDQPISSTPKTGEKDPNNHTGETYKADEDIAAGTCAAPKTWNEVTYCTGCDAKLGTEAKTGEKDPDNHTGETYKADEDVVAGTCAAPKTWNEVTYCADCDQPISSTPKTGEKDPDNHTGETYKVDEDIVAGTCAAPKTWNEVTYCAGCDAKLGTEPKTGAKDPEAHVGGTRTVEEDVSPATCVSPRTWNDVTYCLGCGAKLETVAQTGVVDESNHAGPIETRGYVAPTADTDGYSGDKYCAACGERTEEGKTLRHTKGFCNYCGGYHEGVWGSVVTAIHSILWIFSRFFK